MSNLSSQFKHISATQIVGYISSNGWYEDDQIDDIASIWHRDAISPLEIVVPLKTSLRDYSDRVRSALRVLSEFEGRDILAVFNEVSNFNADVIKIRVAHHDVDAGTIPIDDGILLIQKARDLIASVSQSVISAKKHYTGRKPAEVSDFLDNLLLGQTEHGSFIVNIISPIEEVHPDCLIPDSPSFTRIVSTSLSKSLDAVNIAVDEFKSTGNIDIFDGYVSAGVSANLCDALIGLSGKDRHRQFSITLQLSGLEKTLDVETFTHDFPPKMIPTLELVSKQLKENYILPSYTLSGHVTKLEKEYESESGSVTVSASLDGKDKPVTFQLELKEYLQAIHAHENKAYLECKGELHVSPQSAKLHNVYEFNVFNNYEITFEAVDKTKKLTQFED